MRFIILALCASTAMPLARAASTATPTLENLQHTIQQQQKRIDALEQKSAAPAPEAATDATRIGGYGELHYTNLDSGDEIDFHRFVLYFGHRFSDTTRLDSEVEIEHVFIENDGGESEGGEVALEQAYIEHQWTADWRTRFGLFLMPVGILNERHEPPAFYGVERNPVETFVIPTTWSEGGLETTGSFAGGWSVDLAVSGGLRVENDEPGEEFLIGHAKGHASEAPAHDPAVTARVRWRGVPGLELAASGVYQDDAGQGDIPDVGHATLLEAHAIYRSGPLDVRALYARFGLSGAAPEALNRDRQDGGYVEASFKLAPQLGVFARHSVWDSGGVDPETEAHQTDAGLSYWLVPDVVLKADWRWQGGAADDDGLHLGVGYQF
ncbi:MAG TPA: hypothetical protein VM074_04285 [Solimonas sp.]|nr:hypothetical protein [Solimonas sp.]